MYLEVFRSGDTSVVYMTERFPCLLYPLERLQKWTSCGSGLSCWHCLKVETLRLFLSIQLKFLPLCSAHWWNACEHLGTVLTLYIKVKLMYWNQPITKQELVRKHKWWKIAENGCLYWHNNKWTVMCQNVTCSANYQSSLEA